MLCCLNNENFYLKQHNQTLPNIFPFEFRKEKEKEKEKILLINRKKKEKKFIPSLTPFPAGIRTIHLGRPVILTKSPLPGPLQNKRSKLILKKQTVTAHDPWRLVNLSQQRS